MDSAPLAAPALEQRILRARRAELAPGDASEIVFVAAGEGTLRIGGDVHELAPETGIYVGPAESATVESPDGELELVVVRTPSAELQGERVVSYRDREAEDAGIGREFRLLVESSEATQFIGVIPPGRAKMHNHPYDELAWLVEGEGVLHWHEGESVPVTRGSRIYFPRLVFHSLENTGVTPMRIMGVFHPAGSPADRVEVLDW
jgi:mannose-6-phosphate isomerase-like protein (cupin superfamily)